MPYVSLREDDEELADFQKLRQIIHQKRNDRIPSPRRRSLPDRMRAIRHIRFATTHSFASQYKIAKSIVGITSVHLEHDPEEVIFSLKECLDSLSSNARSHCPILIDRTFINPTFILSGIHPQLERAVPISIDSFLTACDSGLGEEKKYGHMKEKLIAYSRNYFNIVIQRVHNSSNVGVTPISLTEFKEHEQFLEDRVNRYRGKHSQRSMLQENLERNRKSSHILKERCVASDLENVSRLKEMISEVCPSVHSRYDFNVPYIAELLDALLQSADPLAIILTRRSAVLSLLQSVQPSFSKEYGRTTIDHRFYTPLMAYSVSVEKK